jgi:hypothetical protein
MIGHAVVELSYARRGVWQEICSELSNVSVLKGPCEFSVKCKYLQLAIYCTY